MKTFAEYAPKSLSAGAQPRTPLGELKRLLKPPVATLGANAPRAWALRTLEPRVLRALESPTLKQ